MQFTAALQAQVFLVCIFRYTEKDLTTALANHWRNDHPITIENSQQTIMRREERDKKQKRDQSSDNRTMLDVSLSIRAHQCGRQTWLVFTARELQTRDILLAANSNYKWHNYTKPMQITYCITVPEILLQYNKFLPKRNISTTFLWLKAAVYVCMYVSSAVALQQKNRITHI